ncbi:MAG: hypothetical protein M1840_002181 [Geoglossum simile]|nr:MAG: hypothetical protein M1840_002181 [Geoglossum simile]
MSKPFLVVSPGAAKELPWLRNTLNAIGVIDDNEHLRNALEQTLSSPNAIWTLCSIMFQRAPDSQLLIHPNWIFEDHLMMHIWAHVVDVQGHELVFKLTPETISELIMYHESVYLADAEAAACGGWANETAELRDQFANAVNRFVYRTSAEALLDLERDGSGELSCGSSDQVKTAIMDLFPLPSPIDIDIVDDAQIIQQLISDDATYMPSFFESPDPLAL